MRRAIPFALFRRRWQAAAVVLAFAALGWIVDHSGVVEPLVADLPGSEMSSGDPPAFAPSDRATLAARLRIVAVDRDGHPVPDATVEVWADARECMGRQFDSRFMRPEPIEGPLGKVVWQSGGGVTGADGVAALSVPIGMASHVVVRDRFGHQAVGRPRGDCVDPCTSEMCGTCSGPPCIRHRHAGHCGERVTEMTLRLAEPLRVRGHVVDQSGRPVSGARIAVNGAPYQNGMDHAAMMNAPNAWPVDEWNRTTLGPPHRKPILTDRHGRFALEVVEEEPFWVLAAAPGHQVVRSDLIKPTSGSDIDLDIRLQRAESLVVRVVDHRGPPLGGASVTVDSDTALTDSDGFARFDGLDVDAHHLLVQTERWDRVERTVARGQRRLTIELTPPPAVAFELCVDPVLVKRLESEHLLVHLLEPDELVGSNQDWSTMSEEERKADYDRLRKFIERTAIVWVSREGTGRAVLIGAPPGEYTVCITAAGEERCGPKVLAPPADRTLVRLQVAADGSIVPER